MQATVLLLLDALTRVLLGPRGSATRSRGRGRGGGRGQVWVEEEEEQGMLMMMRSDLSTVVAWALSKLQAPARGEVLRVSVLCLSVLNG